MAMKHIELRVHTSFPYLMSLNVVFYGCNSSDFICVAIIGIFRLLLTFLIRVTRIQWKNARENMYGMIE